MGSSRPPIVWGKEARDFPPDPVTGARIVRLSGSSIRTENIYCDAPRAAPDGKRIASWRYVDGLMYTDKALLCHDLTTKWTCLIDRQVDGVAISPPWGGVVYYQQGTMLRRADLATCSTAPVFDLAGLPRCWQLMSVSPDQHYLLYTGVVQEDPETYNIVRLDLRDRSWKYLLPEPETNRTGASYNPVTGEQILIAKTAWEGNIRYGIGVLADADGRQLRTVFSRVHHACWLGDTGRFAGLLEYDMERMGHLPQNPDGELHIYSADGSAPRLIPIPEHLFYHISASPCGRYVVCESLESGLAGPVPIVVVNVDTGQHRVLIGDCQCSGGGDSGRQANPYFTADLRHVIYNADPDGIVNVFAAEIPAGFLESLGFR